MSGKGFIFNDLKSDKGAVTRPALKKATSIDLVPFDTNVFDDGKGGQMQTTATGGFEFEPMLTEL